MKKKAKTIVFAAVLLMVASFISGCTNIGPKTVVRDRFDYNTAITKSWKEQTLLNIVRLRYADMPLFVNVASVVSGYTLEGSVNVGEHQNFCNPFFDPFFRQHSPVPILTGFFKGHEPRCRSKINIHISAKQVVHPVH